ncbi:MAG: hypothetical protein AB7J35_08005 [Dehalococcoidia bacterium]
MGFGVSEGSRANLGLTSAERATIERGKAGRVVTVEQLEAEMETWDV